MDQWCVLEGEQRDSLMQKVWKTRKWKESRMPCSMFSPKPQGRQGLGLGRSWEYSVSHTDLLCLLDLLLSGDAKPAVHTVSRDVYLGIVNIPVVFKVEMPEEMIIYQPSPCLWTDRLFLMFKIITNNAMINIFLNKHFYISDDLFRKDCWERNSSFSPQCMDILKIVIWDNFRLPEKLQK